VTTAPSQQPTVDSAERARRLIVASDLHRSFGRTPALVGASVTLHEGEVLAVMGPSGSGKSTLLHCLAGILLPNKGSVLYGGQPLHSLRDEQRSALRRTEFGQLVPELTALENVALPLRLTGARRKTAEARARDWLARLEADGFAGKRPGELSGGQGQRVAVARALVTGPKVVFADEPTGSLDSLSGEKVLRLLVGAARETAAAVVLVTHEARVAAYADREVIVRDGRTRDVSR
jgi:putative ABC transport system ATP-binding protein